MRAGWLKVESIEGWAVHRHPLPELEDLPVFMIAGGTQLLVSTLLWRVDEVADPADFNKLLRCAMLKILPLSTFGIVTMPTANTTNCSALSAASDLEEIPKKSKPSATTSCRSTNPSAPPEARRLTD